MTDEDNKNCISNSVIFTAAGKFRLKGAYGLPCAYCGEMIITVQKRKELGHILANASGKKLRRIIEKIFSDKKPLTEKIVVNAIKKVSRQHPERNIQELLNVLMSEAQERLIADQKAVIELTRELSAGLTGETKKRTERDFEFIDGILSNTFGGIIFKRKTLINGFRTLLDNETNRHNKSILKKMVTTLPKLPTSGNSPDAFIVKYHRRNSREIAERLLEPYLASGEHVLPESCGGPSHFSNYLVIHKRCNEKRGCIDFKAYLRKNRQMIDLIHRHISAVDSKIKKGYEFDGSDTYIEEVTKRLYEESGGLINWEKFCRLRKKKRKKMRN